MEDLLSLTQENKCTGPRWFKIAGSEKIPRHGTVLALNEAIQRVCFSDGGILYSLHAKHVPVIDTWKDPQQVFYVSMHAIHEGYSTTTKIRVFFDASAKSSPTFLQFQGTEEILGSSQCITYCIEVIFCEGIILQNLRIWKLHKIYYLWNVVWRGHVCSVWLVR